MVSGVGLSADPAKLEVAIVASHVVAALSLLDARLAHLAEANVFILGPLFKLLVNHSVAGGEQPMIYIAALEANLLTTLADDLPLRFTLCPHEFIAARPGTPLDQRICIQHLHLFEFEILEECLIAFWCTGEDGLDIFVVESARTLGLEALDLEHLGFANEDSELLPRAIEAELVLAVVS